MAQESNLSKLTIREQQFVCAVFEMTLKKDGVKVDYKEIVDKLDLHNVQTAYSLNCTIKKKLLGSTETAFKGATPTKKRARAGADDAATPTQKNKRAKKTTPLATKKGAGMAAAEGDDDDDEVDELSSPVKEELKEDGPVGEMGFE